jgi:hypothetical protein
MASSDQLEAFAATISEGPCGLAMYRPEAWAQPTRCFENVLKKVKQDGGECIFGWMFQLKIPAVGEYFVAIHHAVWKAPDGHLFDVTPLHPDSNNHPIMESNGTLFLVDRGSKPVLTDKMLAPRPTRFFPLGDSPALLARVHELEQKEREDCEQIYREHG